MTSTQVGAAMHITSFSDVLCVWAHVAQARIDEAAREFGDALQVNSRCCSVFGDTATKIGVAWTGRGGYAGFNHHLREIGERFDHIEIHPRIWLDARPASSLGVHVTIKAVQLVDGLRADAVVRGLRTAFFAHCRDIAQWSVQREVLGAVGADIEAVERCLGDGAAHAALASDLAEAEAQRIHGSPTFILNEGRQILYGNVGYRVLEANLRELLRAPTAENASWC